MEGNEDLHEIAKMQRTAAPDDVLALLVDYSNQFDLRAGVRLDNFDRLAVQCTSSQVL